MIYEAKDRAVIFNRPGNLMELPGCLARHKECPQSSAIVAGCTDFLPRRKDKSWSMEILTDVTAIPEMQRIELLEDKLRIGAACTHTHIAEDSIVNRRYKALAAACGGIGSPQVRNRGTIGGNVANASPAADTVPVLMALGAKAIILNSLGEYRSLGIGELLTGPGKTAIASDEAIVYFDLPAPESGEPVSAFAKLGDRTVVTIAKISIALAAEKEAGILKNVRICIGAAGAKAFHASAADILEGKAVSELLEADGVTLNKAILENLTEGLAKDIERSIPGRASLPYKARAVKGPAADLLENLLR